MFTGVTPSDLLSGLRSAAYSDWGASEDGSCDAIYVAASGPAGWKAIARERWTGTRSGPPGREGPCGTRACMSGHHAGIHF